MKATLPSIASFDASNIKEVTIIWAGFQSFKNRLLIKNSVTNATVYDITQTTMQLKHSIPALTLTNGLSYTFQVQLFDVNNVANDLSDSVLVRCFTTPTFGIVGLIDGQIVQSPTISAQVSYSQLEGETLSEFKITLYNSAKSELESSSILYDTATTKTFIGLSDSTNYFIRATGVTQYKAELDSGYIGFSVKYITPTIQGIIEATNNELEGYISISSNIKVVNWESNLATFSYINDTIVDLTTTGDYLTYYEGFNISNDFEFAVKVSNVTNYIKPITFSNGTYNICVQLFFNTDTSKYYLKMYAQNSIGAYVLATDEFTLTTDQQFEVWIKRVNNYYQLSVKLI